MVLALKDKWIWDFWLVEAKNSNDGLWHAYFLQADKSLGDAELRHRNVTIGHATSANLKDWHHLGTCFGPSQGPAFDDWTTWTGSVIQGPDQLWHLFYTGTQHQAAGLHQRIGHATSKDMHTWVRVGDGLALDLVGPNANAYEEYTPPHWPDRAMRDPWVMKNPDGAGWIMYFTARVPGRTEPNAGGAIGFATSSDLMKWQLQKPVYEGGAFGQLEVPQVFKYGKKWYMAFCTQAQHWSQAYCKANPQPPLNGNHYLIADSHLGPWSAPKPFLDGWQDWHRYAGKIITMDGKLYLVASIFNDVRGTFSGHVEAPIPLHVDAEGFLHL